MLDFNDAPAVDNDDRLDVKGHKEAIRARLLARIEPLLHWLFPNGVMRGRKFYVGNLQGDAGDSLVIELEGDKAGLGYDHATGESGDLFTFLARHEGLDSRRDFRQVLTAAERWLGDAAPLNPPPRKPKAPPIDTLGPATAKWDYWSADGRLLACVYRYDPPTGKSFKPRDVVRGRDGAPPIRPLYNLPGLAKSDAVVVVEGEKCAQALIDAGICATTLMGGANAPVEKTDLTPLLGKHLLMWPDHDAPGQTYALHVGQAALAVGALSCAILCPPADKPKKWDAADALAEGFDVQTFLATGERITVQPESTSAPDPETASDERTVWGTEDNLALDFTRRYAEDWRYVAQWGQWLVWTGARWQTEQTLCAQHLVREVCRHASLRAGSVRLAAKLASSSVMGGVERLARADRRHAATTEEWDADPWLLNTPGGVVDLHTGAIRDHRREDRMTKLATATPRGACPTWLRFLDDITAGDAELIVYLQRMVGYCLTGVTTEHALFFLYGTGANGKSVFVNTLATILGDYATNAPMDTFMETRGDRHPTDLAGLRGARFVSSIETEQGRRWNESKLKAITGGDKVSARFMRQDFFEFFPQFKLLIAGNHKPSIRNVDEAMKRRLHLIPFTVTIPPAKRDGRLTEKLLAERDGILAWAVEGALLWQQHGLKPPASVVSATEEYFEAEDALGQWIEERCLLAKVHREGVSELFADWREWAERGGEYVGSVKRFSEMMANRNFEKCRLTGGARGIAGIALRPKPHSGYNPYRDN